MNDDREPNSSTSNHDLLIKLDTKLDRAILDIKDLRDNTAARAAFRTS
jgi:hypothetical protein